ncbi:hypothetical protein CRUP_028775 [Coryphaenoides rupestris]|nr:hypothetical protein CRUP_028775 [Coryphaenoides rupestris]
MSGQRMSSNWGDDEIRELLALRADDEIHRRITGTVKDGPLLETLTRRHRQRGFSRDKAQVTSKLKGLRKKFHQVNEQHHHGGGGGGGDSVRLEWPYFDLCQAIWGTGGQQHQNQHHHQHHHPPPAAAGGAGGGAPEPVVLLSKMEEEEEEEAAPIETSPAPGH